LVRTQVIENWEANDEPEHLKTIRDRLLWSQRQGQLLQLYHQIWQQGEIKANDLPEQMELRLSGLVVKQQGKLRVYNPIYQSIFNHSWVENALDEAGLLPKVASKSTLSKAEIQAIERVVSNGLKQFEFQQIEALILAMQAGQTLKALVQDGRPLQDYPTVSPLYALQTILDNIYERNKFKAHAGGVNGVSFSTSGRCIITAGADGRVRIWSLSGQQITEWDSHQGSIWSMSFSRDGRLIVTVGLDGITRLWKASGQELTHWSAHPGAVRCVTFSSNGRIIATVGVDEVQLWNLSGQQLAQWNTSQDKVVHGTFSPDGQSFATAGEDGTIRFWNLSGQQIDQWKVHRDGIIDVSFSPNGKQIATVSKSGKAKLWNLSGQQLVQFNHYPLLVRKVSFSPGGQHLVTAGLDSTIELWHLSGQQLAQLKGHKGLVRSVSFRQDGQYLATGSADGTVRLWDLSEKPVAQWNSHQSKIWSVSFKPDGQYLATAGADSSIRLWNLQGKQLAQLDGHQGWVRRVSFSPDGQYLATAGYDSTVRLWNLEGKQLAQLNGHQGRVNSVSFSPDGQYLATAGYDSTVRLWNLEGKQLSQLNNRYGNVYDVSFSPDGQHLATAEADGTARFWQKSGQQLLEFNGQHGRVYTLSFSPDGQYLATGGTGGTVRLWDLSGQQLAQWQSHQGTVYCISFNLNGQQIATAGADGMAKLWDLSGRQLAQWQSPNNSVYSVVSFSPDGQCLATVGTGGLQIWRIGGLDELLARGCDWLKDYFVAHPEALEKLEVCPNPISSGEAGRNLAGVGDVEDSASAISPPCASDISDELISERGIDYTRLRDLLAAGQWSEADRETTTLMLKISGREAEGWLREEDIEKFPCSDLLTIDELWVKYSSGRFGFSVQRDIWQSVGGTKNAPYRSFCSFGERVGWLNRSLDWLTYSELTFNAIAPVGYLPAGLLDWLWLSFEKRNDIWYNIISSIGSRLSDCSTPSPAPTAVARERLVSTVSNKVGEGFLGEFLVHDKLVRIYQGDITNLVTDVIVSSDDTYLEMNGALSWRIREVGGDEIYREARNLVPLSLGNIAVTTAGKLQAKKIFHGVVIDWRSELLPSQEIIREVVHTCIGRANQYGFQSIVFPLLATGAAGFPTELAWETILQQIIKDLSKENQNVLEVIIALYGRQIVGKLEIKSILERLVKVGWQAFL
jgi:WD40 repeat protein/O-acetyl-ADP-ribose deacetylase (regulator of RNase III)